MKRGLLVTLGIGVGWIVGITVMSIAMPLDLGAEVTVEGMLGNLIIFGFPGFVMLMIALILSLRDDLEPTVYTGKF